MCNTLISFAFYQVISNVPWYQERRLHYTSLGSLVVIILVRTVKYNLSKLRVIDLNQMVVLLLKFVPQNLSPSLPGVTANRSYA